MNPRVNAILIAALHAIVGDGLTDKLTKQISFPSPLRALTEIGMFAGVFALAGYISLGLGIRDMLAPMVPVTLFIMMTSIASGVYRRDITNSIMNIYVHSAYGFFLASAGFLIIIGLFFPTFADSKFIFFFLFFAFFVSNTVRPLISGTDFMDGGGRRIN